MAFDGGHRLSVLIFNSFYTERAGKQMKKKRFFLIFGLLLLLLMTGCNKNTENGDANESKIDKTTPTMQPDGTTEPESTKEPESTREPDITDEPDKKDEQGLSFSFKEESDEAKEEGSVYFTSGIFYPFFEGDGAEALNSFVYFITTRFREYLPGAKERALLDFRDYTGQDIFRFPEVEELTVNIAMENDKWISFFNQWYSDAGGVHPNHYCEAYTVKKENAEELSIEEVLSGYGVSKEAVAAYAAERMCAETGVNPEEFMFVESLPDAVLGFMNEHQWYLTEDALVIFANPYDVAPYAYGLIECKISFEVLQQGLKNQ